MKTLQEWRLNEEICQYCGKGPADLPGPGCIDPNNHEPTAKGVGGKTGTRKESKLTRLNVPNLDKKRIVDIDANRLSTEGKKTFYKFYQEHEDEDRAAAAELARDKFKLAKDRFDAKHTVPPAQHGVMCSNCGGQKPPPNPDSNPNDPVKCPKCGHYSWNRFEIPQRIFSLA